MSELRGNMQRKVRRGIAFGATLGATVALGGCGGCEEVTPAEAEKAAVKLYKDDFRAASPATKFAMQYAGTAKYDLYSTTDIAGYDYYFAVGVGSTCLKNSAYNPEKGTAIVRTNEDDSNKVTVELVEATIIENSDLVFSGAMNGETLQPDADTERVLRDTYHCPVPYEPQITEFDSYSK